MEKMKNCRYCTYTITIWFKNFRWGLMPFVTCYVSNIMLWFKPGRIISIQQSGPRWTLISFPNEMSILKLCRGKAIFKQQAFSQSFVWPLSSIVFWQQWFNAEFGAILLKGLLWEEGVQGERRYIFLILYNSPTLNSHSNSVVVLLMCPTWTSVTLWNDTHIFVTSNVL